MRSEFLIVFICFVITLLSCDDGDCDHLTGKWNKVGKAYINGGIDNQYHNEGVLFEVNGNVFWLVGDILCYVRGVDDHIRVDKFPGAARKGAVAFVIGMKAYVGLGYSEEEGVKIYHDDFWVFDGDTYKWEFEPLSFQFPGKARGDAVAFCLNEKGYVGTGENDGEVLGDFYTFEPQSGWKPFKNLRHQFYGAVAFVADGNAYVCTGGREEQALRDSTYDLFVGLYRLSPNTMDWETLEVMNGDWGSLDGRRINASCFVIKQDGKDYAYIVSGLNQYGTPVASCIEYNPRKDQWREVACIPETTVGGVAFTVGEKGYVLVDQERGRSNTVWEFQP